MKTVLGYHDKQKENYGIIEKKLPVLINERFEPFLLTDREMFTVNTHDIAARIHAFPIRQAVRSLKNTLATILLIPGIITALLYIVDFVSAMAETSAIPPLIPSWLTNLTFWLAIWGAMLLWHETYRTIHLNKRISRSDPFSEHDLSAIKQGDLGLAKKTLINPLQVLDHEAEVLLLSSCTSAGLDCRSFFLNLLSNPNVHTILDRLNLTEELRSLEKLAQPKNLPTYATTGMRSILLYAAEESVLSGSDTIRPEHIFTSFFKLFPALGLYLRKHELNLDLMRFVSAWIQMKDRAHASTRTFDPTVKYFRTGGIARNWIYGYTFVLGHYSKDLTEILARSGGHYGIGHEKEMDEIIATLSKLSKKNVLLIGESGTGKTSVAKGIAERINHRRVPPNLADMRIVQLDVNGLIAAAPQYGNLESLVQTSMDELRNAGNTILFIDEIQEIVGVEGEESKHSLAGILLPYVLDSSFPIIGTITYADYKKYFYARESLRQSFHTVEIKEVSPNAAFEIILTRLGELEQTYAIKIIFPAILSAVELAQRYIYDRKLPDSAVQILETACATAQHTRESILLPAHIAKAVTAQTEIPVDQVSADEATQLLDLENRIKGKVIGQDPAVHQIVEALKRSRTGIRDQKRPIGSFLFLGPTGVGKTHLAKTVGSEYFGEQHQMVRLDMSEFKELSSISRLLGSSTNLETSQPTVTFLDHVKQHPFSVVLLDELEKAHPQILDLFLQVLDDGRMTNANGETITFTNTIIIATSNIGSKTLLDALEKDQAMFEDAKEKVLLELREAVRVEFLNRFDQIIVFAPHTKENLVTIAELALKELKSRLLQKEIALQWDASIPQYVATQSYEPGLGARPMRRFIQDHIESVVAEKLLRAEIKPGDTFTLDRASLAE